MFTTNDWEWLKNHQKRNGVLTGGYFLKDIKKTIISGVIETWWTNVDNDLLRSPSLAGLRVMSDRGGYPLVN